MKRALITLVAAALAGTAAAQAPGPESAKPDGKPALNLRLDDESRAAPRISFDQAPAATTKEEREKGLPELGGKTGAFDRPINPQSSGSPIPQAMEPSHNYDRR